MRFSLTLGAIMVWAAPVFADAAQEALDLINKNRAQVGCAALVMVPQLLAAAKGHATAMAEQNFFSHTGKDGSKMGQRIKAQGYRGRKMAENIAAGQRSAGDAVAAWMSSAGHNRNILDCDFTETGLAMVYQADDQPLKGNSYPFQYYWVQTFGQR
jgi:uncharacterized protein YkwD